MKLSPKIMARYFVMPLFILSLIPLNFLSIPQAKATPPLFAGGDGSQGNPYQVSSCLQLQNVGDSSVVSGNNYFVLTNDINCTDTGTWNYYNNGESAYYGFAPIGSNSGPFVGVFDGHGFTISNLYIGRPNDQGVGLFGFMVGDAKNFKLTGANITGGYQTGGIAGYMGNLSVSLSHVGLENSTITSNSNYTGGLIGYSNGANVYNSYVWSDVTVSGAGNVGGLVGGAYGSNSWTSNIEDSFSRATVTAGSTAGGLIGQVWGGVNILRNYASGHVTGTDGNAGGLISDLYYTENSYGGTAVIQNNFAIGLVSNTNSGAGAGLIAAIQDGTPAEDAFSTDYSSETLNNRTTCISVIGDQYGCNIVQEDILSSWYSKTFGPMGNWQFFNSTSTWSSGTNPYYSWYENPESDLPTILPHIFLTEVSPIGTTNNANHTYTVHISSYATNIQGVTTNSECPFIINTDSITLDSETHNATFSFYGRETLDPLPDGTYSGCTLHAVGSNDDVSEDMPISSFTIDTTPPSVQITGRNLASTGPDVTHQSPVQYVITFSEEVTGFTSDDLVIDNGTYVPDSFTQDGQDPKIYYANVTPTNADNPVNLGLNSGAATDLAGNDSEASEPHQILYSPTITAPSEYWGKRNIGDDTPHSWTAIASSANGNALAVAGKNDYIYTSTDRGMHWTTNDGSSGQHEWSSLAMSNNGQVIVAASGIDNPGFLYLSTNGGSTWTAQDSEAPGSRIWKKVIISDDGLKIAATDNANFTVWNGAQDAPWDWTPANNIDTGGESGQYRLVAGSSDLSKMVYISGAMATSSNTGSTWTHAAGSPFQTWWWDLTSSSDGSKYAAIRLNGPTYFSTDSGANWTADNTSPAATFGTMSDNGRILTETGDDGESGPGYIYTKIDNGSWTRNPGSPRTLWKGIASSSDGQKIAAVDFSGNIYVNMPFAEGDGSADSPYIINDCRQLQAMDFDLTAHYKLSGDIDCIATSTSDTQDQHYDASLYNGGAGFTPVGLTSETPFTGVLDGNGHSINDLTINHPSDTNVGLFSTTNSANIHDLYFSHPDITGGESTGVVAGSSTDTNFSYERITSATVTSTHKNVGGIVGHSTGSQIYYSYYRGNVSGGAQTGGLAGYTTANIQKSYYAGHVTASNDNVGGLVGFFDWNGETGEGQNFITDSYARARVFNDDENAGGLVGKASSSIIRSYAAGSVNAFSYSGGLVGYALGNSDHSFDIIYSFSASKVGGHGAHGFVGKTSSINGTDTLTFDTDYWDSARSTQDTCAPGDVTCHAVNVDNADPNYFLNIKTHSPLNGDGNHHNDWFDDEEGAWETRTANYPDLNGHGDDLVRIPTPSILDDLGEGNTITGTTHLMAYFDADMHDFTADDITVTNGTVANFATTDDPAVYTFDLVPTAAGEVIVSIPDYVAFGPEGDGNFPTSKTYQYGITQTQETEQAPVVHQGGSVPVSFLPGSTGPGGSGPSGGGSPSGSGTSSGGTTQQTQDQSNEFFNDISGHWAHDFINKVHQNCHIDGYKDANGNPLHLFGPNDHILRAELVDILMQCRFPNLPAATVNPYPDVPKDAWYAASIAKAKELGWISGYGDSNFRPLQNITRAEAAKILVLSEFKDSDIPDSTPNFIDTPQVNPSLWYYKYVAFAVGKGFISGYLDSNGIPTQMFGPEDLLLRGQAAKIISKIENY